MPFAIETEIFDILEEIQDKIDIDIENDDDLGKSLIQISLTLPKEAYHKFGPEGAEQLTNFLRSDPIKFIEYFFPGDLEDIEYGDLEKQHTNIVENNGDLHININLCCVIDD